MVLIPRSVFVTIYCSNCGLCVYCCQYFNYANLNKYECTVDQELTEAAV